MNFKTDSSCSLSSTQSITFFGRISLVLLLLSVRFAGLEAHTSNARLFRAGSSRSGAVGPRTDSPANDAHMSPVGAESLKARRRPLQATSVAIHPWKEDPFAVRLSLKPL